MRLAVPLALSLVLVSACAAPSPAEPTGGPDPTHTPTVGATAGPQQDHTATEASDSMCGLPGNDQTRLETAPENTTWDFVGVMRAPSVPGSGPGLIDEDGFRQCYAHSPAGALLAVANLSALATDPEFTRRLNEELVTEGPGRDTVLAELDETGVPTQDYGIRTEILGFNLMGYGPDHARVDLALKGSNGVFLSYTTDLKWEDGDWKVELTPEGQQIIPPAQLPDASGYIPWSAPV